MTKIESDFANRLSAFMGISMKAFLKGNYSKFDFCGLFGNISGDSDKSVI